MPTITWERANKLADKVADSFIDMLLRFNRENPDIDGRELLEPIDEAARAQYRSFFLTSLANEYQIVPPKRAQRLRKEDRGISMRALPMAQAATEGDTTSREALVRGLIGGAIGAVAGAAIGGAAGAGLAASTDEEEVASGMASGAVAGGIIGGTVGAAIGAGIGQGRTSERSMSDVSTGAGVEEAEAAGVNSAVQAYGAGIEQAMASERSMSDVSTGAGVEDTGDDDNSSPHAYATSY